MPILPEPTYNDLVPPTLTRTRDVSEQVHAYLRRQIIDGVLEEGTRLNQAELAQILGVSRIPMREAFRMLQQEGLIAVELNQRAAVRALSVDELNTLYGTRIVMESLGVRVTAGDLTPEELAEGESLLLRMTETLAASDIDGWVTSHRRFHAICSARAEEPLSDLIRSLSERSERYVRLAQHEHPDFLANARDEHRGILEAVGMGDAKRASVLMAEHLGHAAHLIVGDLGGRRVPGPIQEAYILVTGRRLPRRRR